MWVRLEPHEFLGGSDSSSVYGFRMLSASQALVNNTPLESIYHWEIDKDVFSHTPSSRYPDEMHFRKIEKTKLGNTLK